MKLNVIGLTKVWLGISAFLVAGSLIALGVFGLKMGIDFTGGSLVEWQFEQRPSVDEFRSFLAANSIDAVVQEVGDTNLVARAGVLSSETHTALNDAVEGAYPSAQEMRFDSIGPVIGKELKKKSITAVILLLTLILVYVAFAFRKVTEPVASWKYGLLTIIAAIHDVIIPLGVFALLGRFYGFEINTAFIAALLTILGYSINDTIVVFDRTRENLVASRHSDEEFGSIVNRSVQETMARSINTSFTTLLVLLAIYFLGAEVTKTFTLTLIIGITAGAYSSIFLASPLLVLAKKYAK